MSWWHLSCHHAETQSYQGREVFTESAFLHGTVTFGKETQPSVSDSRERVTTVLLSISYRCSTLAQPRWKPEGTGTSWCGLHRPASRAETRVKKAGGWLAGRVGSIPHSRSALSEAYLWLPCVLRRLDTGNCFYLCTGLRNGSEGLPALGESDAILH